MRGLIRFETAREKPSLPLRGWIALAVVLYALWGIGGGLWRLAFPTEADVASRAERHAEAEAAEQRRLAEEQAEKERRESERLARVRAEAEEAAAYAAARSSLDHIRNSLRDPYSVQFRNVWVMRITYGTANATAVCGLFNARNGFGAYVGERPFVAVGRLAWQPGDQRFEEFFQQFCQHGERWFEMRQ